MCGIFGFYCYGNARPSKKLIETGWLANEQRGGDASGVAYLKGEDRKSFYCKGDDTISKFLDKIEESTWTDILASPMASFHTRKWTKGRPQVNANNHPLPYHGWMVVHNGGITNDTELIDHLCPKARQAEVDSEAINAVLSSGDTLEKSLAGLSTLAGTAAFAAWKLDDPTTLLLGRVGSGTPAQLFVGLDEKHRILYFSSEYSGIESIPTKEVLGFAVPQSIALAYDRVAVLQPNATSFYKIPSAPFYKVNKIVPMGPPGGWNNRREDYAGTYYGSTGTGQQTPVRGRISNLSILDDATIRKVKYTPHIDNVVAQWFLDPPVIIEGGTKQQYATPYGTWFFAHKERQFKPHKRVRKWWEQKYGTSPRDLCLDGDQFLPVIEDEVAGLLTDEFDLERVSIAEIGWSSQHGLMCPWCGVFSQYFRWNQWRDRCAWCHLKSKRAIEESNVRNSSVTGT